MRASQISRACIRRTRVPFGSQIMSSERDANNHPPRGSLRLAPNVEEVEEHKRKIPRQFVNFTFYRVRPEWRLLSDAEKSDCKRDFIATLDEFRPTLLIHTYSTVGLRTS